MFSPTLTRRYTPPTCSLEIAAKTSALSQWTGKLLIQELSFELSFDDPRLGPDQRIVIKGDRQQLETLAATINDYVQNFLQDLSPNFELVPSATTVYGYQNTVGQSATVATLPKPQLVTKGLLSHALHLGTLATPESGPTLCLNATQLHDLAEALESYQADMLVLPSLTAKQQRHTVTRWGAIAASVLLVVGLSRTVWQQTSEPETALTLEATDERGNNADLLPPNPHASYTFTPIPTETAQPLDSQRIPPQTVNLNPGPPPSPTPSAAPKSDRLANTPPPPRTSPATEENTALSLAPSIGGQMARSTASDPNEGFAVMDEAESQTTAIAPRFVNPQQQVENYFQAQWQSPPDLQETLEYRLSFSDQGVIRTVFPIGKAAELYQPQLSFLAVGRGVGINLPAENRTFRLVLNPDGRVQTFLEAPR